MTGLIQDAYAAGSRFEIFVASNANISSVPVGVPSLDR